MLRCNELKQGSKSDWLSALDWVANRGIFGKVTFKLKFEL